MSKYSEDCSKSEIDTIVQKSRIYNASNDVTGCLITYKDYCVQILEGPAITVKKLYARIKLDSRHYDVQILSENSIEDRAFGEFAMSYLPINTEGKYGSNLERLRTNLAILSDFTNPVHETAVFFWKNIKEIIDTDS